MSTMRVYQLANDYHVPSKEFVNLLNKNGISVRDDMSLLTPEQVEQFKSKYQKVKQNRKPEKEVKSTNRGKQKEMKNQQTEKQQKNQEKKQKAAPNTAKKRDGNRKNQRQRNKNKNTTQNQNQENRSRSPEDNQNSEKQASSNRRRRNRNRNRQNRQNQTNPQQAQASQEKRSNQKPNKNKGNKPQNKRTGGANVNFSSQPNHNRQKKKKKNYKDKRAEHPVKLRDNSKRVKNKRVDYKRQREEKKADQKRNRVYEIPEMVTVGQLADTLDIAPTELIMVLMQNGTMATINQQIDAETAQIVASELGFEVVPMTTEDVVEKIFEDYDHTVTGKERKRPPVVTVMGHVDHGKTSLLDKIRNSNVTAGEAGGITQHIGAYTVRVNNELITFIDTPGHAAFTAMRSRGAQMTDIAVLVVAADDGVMPQTIEAINHAKAANVPIIVAINKIDKEGANPERVKQELTEQGIVVEEWGGDTIAVPISARQGTNIDELLENILLVAEVEELKADPGRKARGAVIEAEVKTGKGATASLLIQHGTLNVGDTILSGMTYGKIRTMIDDKGKRIRKAGPSMPVEVSGLNDVPEAGDDFIVLEDEKEARQLAQQRQEMEKLERQHKQSINLNDLFTRIQEGQISDVNIIVKADVNGSVEAITQSLERLNTDEVRVNVIHGAVGAVNETDVMLASTSDAIIIAFNVRADQIARAAAEQEEVDVRYYTVIYDAIEDVKKAMEGLLEPEFVEKSLGMAEVREVFRLPGGTMIAGSYVTEGQIDRGSEARITRDGVVIYQGKVGSLRRFKDDVKTVKQGFECGVGVENMNDIKVGDVIETFEMQAIKREL